MKPERPTSLSSPSTSNLTNHAKRSSRMSVFARHYRALMWKNFVLRRRRPYFLVAELLVPVSIPVILLIIRSQEPDKPRPTCYSQTISMPSMGLLSYVQSMVCNFQYACQSTEPPPLQLPLMNPKFQPFIEKLIALSNDRWIRSILSTLDFIGNLSVPVCGVPADQNDIGRLALELKSLLPSMTDGSDTLTVTEGASLNRQRRMANNSPSESTTQPPVNDFCKTVYQFFLTNHIQSFVSRLSFFLFGYIYYYPSTPVTDEIMRRASYPWRLTNRFHTIVKHYLNHTGPALLRLIANNRPLAVSESLLKLCEVVQITQPNYAAEFCTFASRLTSKLGYLPLILKSATRLLETVDQFLDCRNEFTTLYPIQSEQTFKKILELHSSLSFPPSAGVNFLRVPQKTDMSDAEFFEIVLRQLESPNNFRVFDRYWTPRPRQNPLDGDVGFVVKGSLDIQELITGAVVDMIAKRPDRLERPADPQGLYSDELPGQEFKFFPTPCYVQKDFLNSFSRMLPQFMLFAWILTAMLTTKYIVEEKEQRLKEFTRIMGLSALIHWLGWFSITFLITGTSALIIVLMFKLGNIVPLANFFMLLLLSLSYIVAVIALTFLCSTFFTRANLGAIVTAMIYFILYLPTPLIFSNESAMTEATMFAASLSCQVAYSLGLFYFVRMETQGFGAQWQDFWKARFAEDVFSIGKCMLMLWVDAGIYFLLTWYVDNVYPGNYGLRRPFYFPFTRTYWVEGASRTVLATDGESMDSDDRDVRYFEPDQTRNAVGVTVLNVTKKYAKMRKPALENLSIKFYADQITSLLGHNGAGKSTLISILTGMITPSEGTAHVAGYDTQKQLREVHDHLGFCPQYNVLFDHLTVAEHFRFYGSVKGISKLSVRKEIDMFLETLGFQDKRDCLSKTLSGGQKRKLSVAIAFIGDAPVIFLDEPTAGVDPFSRRSIWDLIIDLRKNRTIILTTHHMDEADVLGDRIAILSQGKLRCCGTSLFLKSNHGQGYYLILTRDRIEQTESTSISSNVEAVLDFVRQFMSDIQLVSVTSTEIVLQLPSRYAYDGQFSEFFKTLEADYAKTNCNVCEELRVLGIISYGLSDTSLEEVFLELAEDPSFELAESEIKPETTVEECNQEEGSHSKSNYFSRRKSQISALRVSARLAKYTDDGKLPLPATRQSLLNRTHVYASLSSGLDELVIDSTQLQPNCGQQMKAMFIKRFHYFKRYKLGWAIEFLLPISLIILTMLVVDYFHVSISNSPMSLNPWWMSPPQGAPLNVFYENQMYAKKDPDTTSGVMRTIRQVASIYENALTAAYGYTGTRCVPPNIYKFTPAKSSSCSHRISPPYWDPPEQLSSVARQLARNSSSVQCSCTKGTQDCPANAVQPELPPTVTLQTTDILYNLTAYNVTEYLLKTRDSFIYRRFGGLSFIVHPNPAARGELEMILDPSRRLYLELGKKLFALGLTTLFLAPFVLVIEQRFFIGRMRTYFHRRYPNLSQKRLNKLRKKLAELDAEQEEQLPDDVREEKERAHKFRQSNSVCPNPSVLATDLTKFFRRKKKPSVSRLCFAIHPAECFGLLGLNGAGKTTTFRMLTGSLSPTAGAAYVDGYHVINQMRQAHQSLGFCPQTDALLNTLTGRETLTLYARLRGVPESKIRQVVAKLLNDMGLAPHADKVAGKYSGGNRRKLSTAIAILGSPRVIFLDEPTSGMDPVGKRFLWDQILRLTKAGKAVVLTSHSMEECEALCNRLGIMVNGQFRCLGTVQQLKNRYGNGYIAEVRVTDKPQAEVDVRTTLQSEFPAVTVNKSYNRCHEYQFSQGVLMSKLFTVLNKLRENKWIDQYSVRQTTLDHVFVNFARMQVEPPEVSEGDDSISDVEEPNIETVSTSVEGWSSE
ncbi:ATP-binding cassette sub-family A member 1 [Clonorchis sinensis]|uniref:ATP-binding cassette sub-family A member 1 n=1 Tax=Clonorchis sinensis TaxID=79923 RepID=G7YFR4_CLOSI|nr:ATP-binding cassette sub-family A member 1 [Clonorchis sinensis]